MKKITYLLLTSTIVSNVAFAQKISADKVPVSVIAAFKAKFTIATKITFKLSP